MKEVRLKSIFTGDLGNISLTNSKLFLQKYSKRYGLELMTYCSSQTIRKGAMVHLYNTKYTKNYLNKKVTFQNAPIIKFYLNKPFKHKIALTDTIYLCKKLNN